MKRFIIFSAPFLLLACTVGPDYVKPAAEIPPTYKEFTATPYHKVWDVARPNDDANRGEWWLVFNDPVLNDLISKLNTSNQNILNAEANYRNALALIGEARAIFFPTITSDTFVATTRNTGGSSSSSAGTISSATAAPTASTNSNAAGPTIFNNHSVLLDFAWQPDIWGKVARTVEASVDYAQSTAALLALTTLSSQSLLAQSYFQLATLDSNQIILDESVVQYNKVLSITENQYTAGVAQRLNVVQAIAGLKTAEASAVNNAIARAQTEHAIAVLIGKPPAEFSMPPRPLTAVPPIIPVEIPSRLLERRPDVAQAERLMAQANAKIGVAVAAYYPTLSLTAISGFIGAGLGRWFSTPLYWTFFPDLNEILFDGGLRDAEVEAARATYDASIASYRQTLLTAFQNVEDNLVALKILAEQSDALRAVAKNDEEAVRINFNQYKAGIVDYVNVSNAKIVALTAEQNFVTVQGLRMTTAVNLIVALGGGWDAAILNKTPPVKTGTLGVVIEDDPIKTDTQSQEEGY